MPHDLNQQRILCLWLPSWPIQRIVVSQPELRRGQIVLFRRDPRRGQRVAAASPLAIRSGVRSEMSLSEANALLNRSGKSFEIFEHDPAADLAALKQFADSLSCFSPIVGWAPTVEKAKKTTSAANTADAATARSAILLDVTGLAHLFGDEAGLVQDLEEHCRQAGYLPRIAIADTLGMAWALAHFSRPPHHTTSPSPHLPIAQPPDLPIEALRLAPATITTLKQLGIETIEQLQQLPRPELAMRFGREIHDRIDQAFGAIPEPIIAHRPPAEFSAEQLLDYPTRHLETITVIIGRLVTQICDQLRSRQHGALQWTVRMAVETESSEAPTARSGIRQNSFPSGATKGSLATSTTSEIQFVVNLFQATATHSAVVPLVEMQLEQLQNLTRHPITEISVTVTSGVLLVQQQRQLFDENPRLDKQALAQLINRLTSRLGSANVVYPKLCAGAQPEYSYRLHPLVDAKRKKSRRRNQSEPSSHVAGRPLKIFRPAISIRKVEAPAETCKNCEVEAPAETSDGWLGSSETQPPARAPLGAALRSTPATPSNVPLDLTRPSSGPLDLTDRIVRRWGPERIETGWWRGLTVCRDYWRIEIDSSQQLWIYRDLRNNDWFLQGEF